MGPASSGHDVTFEELCDIVAPIARKHGMLRIWIFGSRARGDNQDDSDYDFCVLAPKECSLLDFCSFISDLEDVLGTKVDAVSENATSKNPYFKEEMLHDRKVVFEA
ncbi:MAG: nucleotidyltransferase domain-containing protein [Methanomassiliicoccaceae archaeon]|nr:nucleotidyltransferase domain-containing protein [Methanomassiliicoccaceae archaeon]